MCTSWGYICVCETVTDIKAIDVALLVNVSWHSFIITFCVGLFLGYPVSLVFIPLLRPVLTLC